MTRTMFKRTATLNTVSVFAICITLFICSFFVEAMLFPNTPSWEDRLRKRQEQKLEFMEQVFQQEEEDRKARITELLKPKNKGH